MMRATARHTTKNTIIDLDVEVPFLMVNRKRGSDLDAEEVGLLCFLIEVSPKVAKSDIIFGKVFGRNSGDPGAFIRKKVHELRRKIDGEAPDLIATIRGAGLSLGKNWERINGGDSQSRSIELESRPQVHASREELVEKIESISEKAILIMRDLSFRCDQTERGLRLMLNGDPARNEIAALADFYGEVSVDLLVWVNGNCKSIFESASEIVYTIETYIKMSRKGFNITQEQWRQFYEVELRHHVLSLKFILDLQVEDKR